MVCGITVIEDDVVSVSNLNRQFMYRESDIGKKKVELAISYLKERNSSITISGIDKHISKENVSSLLGGYDVVVDCVDNVETRMVVNDYCVEQDVVLVEAGINSLYGFVMSIKKDSPCLRCIGYQNTKLVGDNEALGAAVGIVASLEALEVIKHIVGMDTVLFGTMLMIDCNEYEVERITLHKSETCTLH